MLSIKNEQFKKGYEQALMDFQDKWNEEIDSQVSYEDFCINLKEYILKKYKELKGLE